MRMSGTVLTQALYSAFFIVGFTFEALGQNDLEVVGNVRANGIIIGHHETAEEGSFRYNTTDSTFEGHDGTQWRRALWSNSVWNSGANGSIYYNGNVGIGTSTPGALLELGNPSNSTQGGNIVIGKGNLIVKGIDGFVSHNHEAIINLGGGGNVITGINSNGLKIEAGDALGIFVKNGSGLVGIGTTTPTQKLDVSGGNALIRGHNWSGTNDEAKLFLGDNNHYIKSKRGHGVFLGTFNAQDALLLQESTGNVGIGTTAPHHKLDLGQTLGKKLALYQNDQGNSFYGFGISNETLEIHAHTDGNTPAKMVVKSDGKVGFGTTSPAEKLDIADGEVIIRGSGDFQNTNNYASLYLGNTNNFIRATKGHGVRISAAGTDHFISIKSTTGYVGIGTAEPKEKLTVNGKSLRIVGTGEFGPPQQNGEAQLLMGGADAQGNSQGLVRTSLGLSLMNKNGNLILSESGDVGIGKLDPQQKLDVNGAIKIGNTSSSSIGTIRFDSDSKVFQGYDGTDWVDLGHSAQGQWTSVGNGIQHGGNIGIGVGPTAENKLTVHGKVYISDDGQIATINQTYADNYLLWVEKGIVSEDFAIASKESWSDHVFGDDYKLATIEELENHIKEHGHLPGIPSEQEVSANGYTMHDMNKRFLQKIEELTLYTIQQNKQIRKLEDENRMMKEAQDSAGSETGFRQQVEVLGRLIQEQKAQINILTEKVAELIVLKH